MAGENLRHNRSEAVSGAAPEREDGGLRYRAQGIYCTVECGNYFRIRVVTRILFVPGVRSVRDDFFKEENKMKYEILKLLARNAKYTAEDIAVMLGADEEEVKKEIKQLEKDGFIRGYRAVIDWEKIENPYVSAIIEINVVPKAGLGFEEVAEKIMKHPEVESVYLMSGVYDLNVVVKAKTLQDIARFVAKELATIDSVTSTTTHFVMRRYKEMDVELVSSDEDDRGQLWI